MAMLQAYLDTRRAEKKLSDLSTQVNDLSYPLKEIGEYMMTEIAMRFERGVDSDGKPWIPSKRSKKDRGKTLVDKGILRQSITYKASDDSVEIGVGKFPPYARIHQMGGRTGRGHRVNLPARPYLGINDSDVAEAQRIITQFLQSSMRR
jgi:phage virion morphogenesis protein